MLMKILKTVAVGVIVIGAAAWLFWPKEFAVKGPMLDFLLGRQVETPAQATLAKRFKLPDGFRIGIFASNINNARSMAVTETGDVLVASMRPGEVILLHRDADGDGASDDKTVLLQGLDYVHGVALHDGYLYTAETETITRRPFDAEKRLVGNSEVVFTGMPPGGNHRSRSIGFGPDGMMYVTVGSSCNVCIEDQPYRAEMLRMQPDGSDMEIYATGLRNSVGFDWQPATGALFATDNGRDLLGDDTPHCELNLIKEGADYGWPYAYDDQKPDPDFGPGNEDKVAGSQPMVHGFGAHRAPLGIRFLKPELTPAGFEGAALVALHGSWNRSTLAGYKVVSLHFAADGTIEQRDFLTGFEENEDVIGRPVEIAQGPDGGIYVSDDYSGTIYKIGWGDIAVPGFEQVRPGRENPLATYSEAEVETLAITGAAVYANYGCAACHDPNTASEGTAVKLLQGLGDRYDVPALRALFENPPGPMPSFEFSEPESEALAVYLLKTFGAE